MAAYTPDKHGPIAVTNVYSDAIASDGSNQHIIRTITIVNTDASSRNVFVSIGAGAAATEIVETAVPANSTIVLNGWWVVPTSTAVQMKASVTLVCTLTLSGYHYA